MRSTVFDKPDSKVKLERLPTEPPEGMTREEAEERFRALGQELFDLQDLLWGAKTHGVLVILQGRDTAGKDGAIKNVVGCLNPRGVQVASFAAPTPEELGHDFLWRIHSRTPRKGEFAIFNRSHYEDVLVVRVRGLLPEAQWRPRYAHINGFESLLCEEGTIILKYFLHISKAEQKGRLLAREEDEKKTWKLSVDDWKDRERWDDYTAAYEEAISACASKEAPWVVVPGDSKWYRNLAIAESLVATLRPYKGTWEAAVEALGRKNRHELEQFRLERAKNKK